MNPSLTPTQLAALKAAVSIAFGGGVKPKGSQLDFVREQAEKALAILDAAQKK